RRGGRQALSRGRAVLSVTVSRGIPVRACGLDRVVLTGPTYCGRLRHQAAGAGVLLVPRG
ncbi:hypothetical protein, partial [Streptomyces benahoarensis]|uniref:hypothetical protein n=1 Tax=Streptomyces benahoarensis TaxID=2595054 RepID=UPI001C8F5E74